MTDDELERVLGEWGALSKYQQEKDSGGGGDVHVLHRNRDFAPGTRARAVLRLAGRDGTSRRAYMARDLLECGVRMVPAAFVDPIPSPSTGRGGGGGGSSPQSVPAELRRVEAAALELYRNDKLCGLCLRHEYCGYGRQSDKADAVAHALGAQIGLRVYRESLARAKGWMHARLASQAA